jgi:hypothetical protein
MTSPDLIRNLGKPIDTFRDSYLVADKWHLEDLDCTLVRYYGRLSPVDNGVEVFMWARSNPGARHIIVNQCFCTLVGGGVSDALAFVERVRREAKDRLHELVAKRAEYPGYEAHVLPDPQGSLRWEYMDGLLKLLLTSNYDCPRPLTHGKLFYNSEVKALEWIREAEGDVRIPTEANGRGSNRDSGGTRVGVHAWSRDRGV